MNAITNIIKNPLYGSFSIIALSLLSLLFAYIAQYGFDLFPCAWCIFQRLVICVLIIILSFSFFKPLRVAIFLCSLVVSLIGLTSSFYLYFIASKLETCELSFAERVINTLKLQELFPSFFSILSLCSSESLLFYGINFSILGILYFLAVTFSLLYYLHGLATKGKND